VLPPCCVLVAPLQGGRTLHSLRGPCAAHGWQPPGAWHPMFREAQATPAHCMPWPAATMWFPASWHHTLGAPFVVCSPASLSPPLRASRDQHRCGNAQGAAPADNSWMTGHPTARALIDDGCRLPALDLESLHCRVTLTPCCSTSYFMLWLFLQCFIAMMSCSLWPPTGRMLATKV
jgi:hypothetical protein